MFTSTSAADHLGRLVSRMIYIESSGRLNSAIITASTTTTVLLVREAVASNVLRGVDVGCRL